MLTDDIMLKSKCAIEWSALAPIRDDVMAWVADRAAAGQRVTAISPQPSSSPARIGAGAFGCVWRVTRRGVPMAVKVFDTTVFEPSALRRVLGHANVVYIVGYCSEPAGVVMELVTLDGAPCSLAQWLAAEACSPSGIAARDKLALLQQVCDGMAFVHDQGLVHSDLKPGNVLVTRYSDGGLCAKIGDFGLAIDVSSGPARRLGGTDGYACPCDDVTATDKGFDVWSFGVLMVEVLTGRGVQFNRGRLLTWRSDDSVQSVLAAEVAAIGACSGVTGGGAVWSLVRRCLACDSRQRPAFQEVSRELDRLRAGVVAGEGTAAVAASESGVYRGGTLVRLSDAAGAASPVVCADGADPLKSGMGAGSAGADSGAAVSGWHHSGSTTGAASVPVTSGWVATSRLGPSGLNRGQSTSGWFDPS